MVCLVLLIWEISIVIPKWPRWFTFAPVLYKASFPPTTSSTVVVNSLMTIILTVVRLSLSLLIFPLYSSVFSWLSFHFLAWQLKTLSNVTAIRSFPLWNRMLSPISLSNLWLSVGRHESNNTEYQDGILSLTRVCTQLSLSCLCVLLGDSAVSLLSLSLGMCSLPPIIPKMKSVSIILAFSV